MYSLLVTADHLLVVVVDVFRGWTGTAAGRHDVPAILSGGPGKPVTWVSRAAHHQVRVARVSPAVPELRVPGDAPGPVLPEQVVEQTRVGGRYQLLNFLNLLGQNCVQRVASLTKTPYPGKRWSMLN